MRSIPWCVVGALSLYGAAAHAERTGGGGSSGGGGALGHVSAGLGAATRGGSGSPSSNPSSGSGATVTEYDEDYRHPECRRWAVDHTRCIELRPVIVVGAPGSGLIARSKPPEPPTAHLDLYAGASKVHDSDGSVSLDLAVSDGWFRLAGSYTRYYEHQANAETLTLSVPTLMGGIRIDDGKRLRVYLEGGLAGAKTQHDMVMDTSITGVIGGIHLETPLAHRTAVVADAHAMAFEDHVRAYSARVGVRFSHVEASLRVLDFNVGPALYGPEIGMRF